MVARELARVCRPGGLIVLCNWTSDGKIGELFRLMGRHLPPPPAFASPPPLWGDEEHVRGLFAPLGVELTFERHTAALPFATPEDYVEHFERFYGPSIKAKEALDPSGDWAPVREEWQTLAGRFHRDGAVQRDYFVISGRRAG